MSLYEIHKLANKFTDKILNHFKKGPSSGIDTINSNLSKYYRNNLDVDSGDEYERTNYRDNESMELNGLEKLTPHLIENSKSNYLYKMQTIGGRFPEYVEFCEKTDDDPSVTGKDQDNKLKEVWEKYVNKQGCTCNRDKVKDIHDHIKRYLCPYCYQKIAT